MKIHAMNYDYLELPAGPVLMLLESHFFMWVIVLVTVGFMVWVLAKAWQLHSLPKKMVKGQSQAKLVFWMCLLGLAWKPLWLAAVILILIDWQALAGWIRSVIHVNPVAVPVAQELELQTETQVADLNEESIIGEKS